MFFKRNANSISVDSFIGEKASFEGNLILEGTIRVDGKVTGEIKVTEDVIIGQKAKIIGDITANNTIISGIVEGNINTKGQLRLTSTAELTGNIKMSSFIADEGSIFQGKCDMLETYHDKEIPSHNKEIPSENKAKIETVSG